MVYHIHIHTSRIHPFTWKSLHTGCGFLLYMCNSSISTGARMHSGGNIFLFLMEAAVPPPHLPSLPPLPPSLPPLPPPPPSLPTCACMTEGLFFCRVILSTTISMVTSWQGFGLRISRPLCSERTRFTMERTWGSLSSRMDRWVGQGVELVS